MNLYLDFIPSGDGRVQYERY